MTDPRQLRQALSATAWRLKAQPDVGRAQTLVVDGSNAAREEWRAVVQGIEHDAPLDLRALPADLDKWITYSVRIRDVVLSIRPVVNRSRPSWQQEAVRAHITHALADYNRGSLSLAQ